MAISATDKELLIYFSQLDEPQKKSLLKLIKTFLKPGNPLMESTTVKQYNQELDEALKRIEKGEFTTLEALEKEMQLW
ncbi:MAG TPA: hypothetical protein PK339_05370 [Flavitalea sp.]|nr:hypothetical protein [Flavitalea sp.]